MDKKESRLKTKRHFCHLCAKSYVRKYSLYLHVLGHKNMRPWACDVCGKRFTQKCHRDRHTYVHEKTEEKADKSIKHSDAGEVIGSYSSHEERSTSGRYSCRLCEKSYTNKYSLNRHQLWHENKKPWTCDYCGKQFTQKCHCDRHSKIHKKRGVEVSGEWSSVLSEKQGILPSVDDNYQAPEACKYCNKLFRKKTHLNVHLQKHMGRRFSCQRCDKSFSTNHSLKKHLMRHDSVFPWICEVCGSRFITKFKLKRHAHTHAVNKVITCICCICGKGFTNIDNLKLHHKVHSDERPFQCQICGQQYKNAGSLKVHSLIHKGIRPFKCDICLREFRVKMSFKKHMELHKRQDFGSRRASITPPSVFCNLCGVGFIDKRNLVKHNKKHQQGTLKRFNRQSNRNFTRIQGYVRRRPEGVEVINQGNKVEHLTIEKQHVEGPALKCSHDICEKENIDTHRTEANEIKEDENENIDTHRTVGNSHEIKEDENENIDTHRIEANVHEIMENCDICGKENKDTHMSKVKIYKIKKYHFIDTEKNLDINISDTNVHKQKESFIAASHVKNDMISELGVPCDITVGINEIEVETSNVVSEHQKVLSADMKLEHSDVEPIGRVNSSIKNQIKIDKSLTLEIGQGIACSENEPITTKNVHEPVGKIQTLIKSSHSLQTKGENDIIPNTVKVTDRDIRTGGCCSDNDMIIDKTSDTLESLATRINSVSIDAADSETDLDHSNEEVYIYLDSFTADNTEAIDDDEPPVPLSKEMDLGKQRKDIVGFLRKPRNYSLEQAAVTRFARKPDNIKFMEIKIPNVSEINKKTMKGEYGLRISNKEPHKNNVFEQTNDNVIVEFVDFKDDKSTAYQSKISEIQSLGDTGTLKEKSEEQENVCNNKVHDTGSADKTSIDAEHVCSICDKSFKKLNYLRKHRRNMHPEHDIVLKWNKDHSHNIASQNTGSSVNVIQWQLQPNDIQLLECSLCRMQFSHINKLIGHVLRTHETIGKINSGSVTCMICGNSYKADARSLKHITEHIVSLNTTLGSETKGADQTPSCDKCGKHFTHKGHLQRHIKANACSANYICDFCDNRYHTSGQLRVHKKQQHDVKAYECPLCQKLFQSSSGLRKHKMFHVNGTSELAYIRPYMCSICGKQYTTASSLKTHMIVHTNTRPFKCDKCNSTYLQRSHLLRHISVFHMGVRKFKCDTPMCSKSFIDKRNLVIHKRSHTNEKPFYCPECDHGFSQKQNLTAHLKTHNKVKGFECIVCKRQLSSKLSLMRHMDRHEDTEDVSHAVS